MRTGQNTRTDCDRTNRTRITPIDARLTTQNPATHNFRLNIEEKVANRATEAFRLGEEASGSTRPSADVVPIRGRPAPTDDTDYSLPTIDEILRDDDD